MRELARQRLGPVLLGVAIALLSWPARARAQDAPRAVFEAVEPAGDIVVDGVLDEPDWDRAAPISELTMIEPVEGGPPTGNTTIRALASPKALVLGISCGDPEPSGIVSFTKERDGDLGGEDHVKIVLDPFRDGRTGYVFAVNPGGARYDALIANRGESENKSWDGIWEAATHRGPEGWSLEIRIPIQTLNFDGGHTRWGFNIERRIQRLLERHRWASPRRDWRVTQTSRAGVLAGLPEFDLGLGLGVRPAVTSGYERGAGPEGESSFEPSLDVQERLGATTLASLTVKTDFAETEVDNRQTNLTRFPLFFPEKRTFFLEGADIFDFGLGLGSDLIPFFSRRVGLLEGREVPILAGGKVNGRLSDTNFGALAVRTESVGGLVPDATLGVVRVSRNVFAESSAGAIATFGDPRGRTGSWLAGADFTYQTSRLRGDKNFLVGVWGIAMERDGLEGDKNAWGAKIDYPNDLWDVAFTFRRLGDGFDPSLGFVPRNAYRSYRFAMSYMPRPDSSWIRQHRFQLFPELFTNLEGRWESYRVFTAPVNVRFESGGRFELNVVPAGERLDEPFEIAENVTIPPGPYDWFRYRFVWEFAAKRKLSGQAAWWFGGFYGGRLDEILIEGSWTPSPIVTFQLTGERNVGDIPFGKLAQTLVGTRVRLNLSPDLQLNSLIQYDDVTDSLGSNTRLRWTFRPEGDLFIIYNHGVRRLRDRFTREAQGLLVKLQYMFRR